MIAMIQSPFDRLARSIGDLQALVRCPEPGRLDV
jgi:hypothetical protein